MKVIDQNERQKAICERKANALASKNLKYGTQYHEA